MFTRCPPSARKLTRFFCANSFDTELDAAGRVMVPAFLLDHAGLGKEVVVTGAGECLEVWDRAAWAAYNAALSDELPEITAALRPCWLRCPPPTFPFWPAS